MKIEVGKQYRMANGNVATIMEFQPHASHPWRGMFGTPDNGGSMSWDDDGEQCNAAADYRIVAENVAPLALKIEIGKRYVTRHGEVTTPLEAGRNVTGSLDRDQYHQFGATLINDLDGESSERHEWRHDGRFDDIETPLDLISEYTGHPTAAHVEKVAIEASRVFEFSRSVAEHVDPATIGAPFTLTPDDHPARPDSDVIADLERIMSDDYRPAVAAWFNARYGA